VSHAEEPAGTRRDFLYYATAGAGAVAVGAATWPLINQMNPSADVQALSSIYVDVSAVDVGTQLTVKGLGKPVFIRRRAPEEIEAAVRKVIAETGASGPRDIGKVMPVLTRQFAGRADGRAINEVVRRLLGS